MDANLILTAGGAVLFLALITAFKTVSNRNKQKKQAISEVMARHPGIRVHEGDGVDKAFFALDDEAHTFYAELFGVRATDCYPKEEYRSRQSYSLIEMVAVVIDEHPVLQLTREMAADRDPQALADDFVSQYRALLAATDRIKQLVLHVEMSDDAAACHELSFWHTVRIKPSDSLFKETIETSSRALSDLVRAICLGAQDLAPPPSLEPVKVEKTAADLDTEKIRELWRMKEDGILTEDEFEAQKQKLLI